MKAKAYAIVEKDGDSLNILQTPRTNKLCVYTSRGRAQAQLDTTTREWPTYEYKRCYPVDAFVLELVGEIDDQLDATQPPKTLEEALGENNPSFDNPGPRGHEKFFTK